MCPTVFVDSILIPSALKFRLAASHTNACFFVLSISFVEVEIPNEARTSEAFSQGYLLLFVRVNSDHSTTIYLYRPITYSPFLAPRLASKIEA